MWRPVRLGVSYTGEHCQVQGCGFYPERSRIPQSGLRQGKNAGHDLGFGQLALVSLRMTNGRQEEWQGVADPNNAESGC